VSAADLAAQLKTWRNSGASCWSGSWRIYATFAAYDCWLTGGRASARQMASSLKLMQRCLNEMLQIGMAPIEFEPSPRAR